MPADRLPSSPGAVLFACNFNRVRSPMAEALLRLLVGTQVFVDSCGLQRASASSEAETGEAEVSDAWAADPFAQAVIAELGGDLSQHRPKTFDDLEDNSFDLVISLTPQAQHRAVELARARAADIEYWPTPDPTLTEGSREARLAAYRQVRDALAQRIAERFGPRAGVPIDLDPPSAL